MRTEDHNIQEPAGTTTNVRVVAPGMGAPEALALHPAPVPRAGRGRVVVEVEAAGISYAEVQMLERLHPFPPKFPFVPGYDLVGRVTEVGKGVTGIRPGDRVAAMPRKGSWTRFAEVPAKSLTAVPGGIDPAEAVSLVTNGVTAWQMLHRLARVRSGQSVLVHGASGGVGTLLTALAVRNGIRVIGTASPGKHERVRALGAHPLDYRSPDLPHRVRELAPDGVAAVFDHIGGSGLDQGWAMLAPGGVLVSFDSSVSGHAPGQWFRPHVPAMRRALVWNLKRRLGLTGGRRMSMYYVKPDAAFRSDLDAMYRLVLSGDLRPPIAERYALAEAGAAMRRLMNGGVVGKLVLIP
ncbi:NADPH2:quinone reductase [Nocardiopsis arvandica]|uniref:NADPH2:quinone reductase n=1 Tax=Nocardiopsis sinuspersici TaxID=501010 RepID=A0A7Z0BLA9_9ACTN|nr:zinc-binding dehydrogenase [Nocardiopsis sinuspersici]NYH55668.1 NADPH2:quinone reductase [Nocardiopsis sinuspersici]